MLREAAQKIDDLILDPFATRGCLLMFNFPGSSFIPPGSFPHIDCLLEILKVFGIKVFSLVPNLRFAGSIAAN